MIWCALDFFGWALSDLLGLLSGNGARYWRMNEGFLWDIEAMRNPCGGRDVRGDRLKMEGRNQDKGQTAQR